MKKKWMLPSRSQENICCLFMVAYLLFIPGGKPFSKGRSSAAKTSLLTLWYPLRSLKTYFLLLMSSRLLIPFCHYNDPKINMAMLFFFQSTQKLIIICENKWTHLRSQPFPQFSQYFLVKTVQSTSLFTFDLVFYHHYLKKFLFKQVIV